MEPFDPPTSRNTGSMISRALTRVKSFKQQNSSSFALRTAKSQTSGRSEPFKAQAEREAAQPRRCQQRVRAYTGLTWELIRSLLSKKWPDEDFKEERIHDSWVFETPEPLTKEDMKAITNLRDKSMAQSTGRRRSVTPE
ncbi:uncharacterized protein GGS22DRAFT_152258 [Annulohypoxylon maeteangense]|uniref:uncharacterized protein n=1 Tax=Annulohypoxylon maeteangense TaxID=1927788 RepID=UPI0020088F38|nr:uncharacterized protein GGS22DRAFT_152258 [Annulohypoxylon maeteangense]KAI0888743.1 hypothetical protein GGS22DRAFT_152258 [Annulohypoxylon maeteangense]